MWDLIIDWLIGYKGVRVGEASNPGPESFFRIAFGNVSSMILHQNYLNTVPCDVFGLCETRLNDTGVRLIQDWLQELNWTLPLSQRPISVVTIIYRIWAATRARQCVGWQEMWIHTGQHGCRAKHNVSDVLARISVAMETAMLNGEQLVGAAVDFAKAFDNIPTTIALAVLRRMGLDPKVLDPLTTMYAVLKRRLKMKVYLGEPFRGTNGIMQGDLLSCMVLNGLVSVLSNFLDRDSRKLVNQSYVDDMTLLISDERQLQHDFDKLMVFLTDTKQEINIKKTYVFGVNSPAPKINVIDKFLLEKEFIKILGVIFGFTGGRLKLRYSDNDLAWVSETSSQSRAS